MFQWDYLKAVSAKSNDEILNVLGLNSKEIIKTSEKFTFYIKYFIQIFKIIIISGKAHKVIKEEESKDISAMFESSSSA